MARAVKWRRRRISLPYASLTARTIVTAVEDCSKCTPGVVKVMSCLSMPCSRSAFSLVEIAMPWHQDVVIARVVKRGLPSAS